MRVKSVLATPFASMIARRIRRWSSEAHRAQEYWLHKLVTEGRKTLFGRDHGFQHISSYADFSRQVPLRSYEDFIPYLQKVYDGQSDVLWKGRPLYFAKSSGTTAGIKYIPISKDSISNHINTARNALLMYIDETRKTDFVNGRMIFLSGSPRLELHHGIPTGRLSGIVNHHVPRYLRRNQLPSFETNCIEDWEQKLECIVQETINENMTLVSGIPPWMQMYFERLLQVSGKTTVKEVFPHLQLIIYGGVNFEPYRARLLSTIGGSVDTIETYPASEGFIAFQDKQNEPGMLLNVDSGIFFEFVPAQEIHEPQPTRLRLADVELDTNYALVLSTNAGLWAYVIGDTVKFVSKNPYRLIVTGRTKHFISAFGEHVIAEEVESSLMQAAQEHRCQVTEFTVAPQVNPPSGNLPYHEWFIEFAEEPASLSDFARRLDELMCARNIYYNDLISGRILQPLRITRIQKGGFIEYMKSIGKLGGQNKLPRLANDRSIADALTPWILAAGTD
ncbi:MAG: GH3 auxin-responsive promoter family protein [Chitinophagales bacterium]|nr:GH3 auxin-responsive promoter family protein [Chitinophagales bacterium]MDW8427303.1 GH3 auxin-responsive promoter family protein [Chitinophagales bacterium]